MRCDRFSFLIALQREERASSLQPHRPPSHSSHAKSYRRRQQRSGLIQGSCIKSSFQLGPLRLTQTCLLQRWTEPWSPTLPPRPGKGPPSPREREGAESFSFGRLFLFSGEQPSAGRAVWLFLLQVMSLSGGSGVEALWWNRLADWSFSGWDEGQNAWMETVFSVLSVLFSLKQHLGV